MMMMMMMMMIIIIIKSVEISRMCLKMRVTFLLQARRKVAHVTVCAHP